MPSFSNTLPYLEFLPNWLPFQSLFFSLSPDKSDWEEGACINVPQINFPSLLFQCLIPPRNVCPSVFFWPQPCRFMGTGVNVPEFCNPILGIQVLVTGVVETSGESLRLGLEQDIGVFQRCASQTQRVSWSPGDCSAQVLIQQVVAGRDSAGLMSSLRWSKAHSWNSRYLKNHHQCTD